MRKIMLPVATAIFLNGMAFGHSQENTSSSRNSQVVKCEPVKYQPVAKLEDKIYQFSVSISCKTKSNSVEVINFEKMILNYIEKNNAFSITKPAVKVRYKGLDAVKLELVETRNSSHGIMHLDCDSYFMHKSRDQFIWETASKNIKASGNAKYTEAEVKAIEVNQASENIKFIITKNVNVKKPFFAPSSQFESGVLDGLKADLEGYSQQVGKMLVGSN